MYRPEAGQLGLSLDARPHSTLSNACGYQFDGRSRSHNGAGGAQRVPGLLGPEAASHGQQLVVHEVETQDGWPLALIEVAHNGITDQCPQLVQVISLGEDRLAESPGCVTTFRRFFHHKDEFRLRHVARVVTVRPDSGPLA